ncbi:hypothetical protein COCSUDRAFT_34414 [Coccomyxa subellipsoidea C-169]|uniref:Uncharacterized protein n=1 Tax=Coccomyxa subellipsoidea (strain C-169) TaxID=574566 RepID=I0YKG3_COCSC|nr:hypothetical protein COCSUDRAFT_34414 [Coccomyxa subellipsoidea C-169]EIE18882.1 hypothetical protein COCSUDRAFT_34414 [Coccomyxa subellipsoidea C-169]|eukprot:XP_005643426.1 hypothetical protein COCSUDRAFT_34414 [Coccomyxa subellipsoidea C-169]
MGPLPGLLWFLKKGHSINQLSEDRKFSIKRAHRHRMESKISRTQQNSASRFQAVGAAKCNYRCHTIRPVIS